MLNVRTGMLAVAGLDFSAAHAAAYPGRWFFGCDAIFEPGACSVKGTVGLNRKRMGVYSFEALAMARCFMICSSAVIQMK